MIWLQNGRPKFRDEFLNREIFYTSQEAKMLIEIQPTVEQVEVIWSFVEGKL